MEPNKNVISDFNVPAQSTGGVFDVPPPSSSLEVTEMPVTPLAPVAPDLPMRSLINEPAVTDTPGTQLQAAKPINIPLQFNKQALFYTIGAAFVIALLSAGIILLASKGREPSGNLAVNSNYAVSNLPIKASEKDASLELGQAEKLAINGQLEVNKGLVVTPGAAPAKPTAGSIYYDKTTNQPYYYNGKEFVPFTSEQQQQIGSYVQNVGGINGDVQLGSGLVANGNTLGLTSSVLGAISGPKVTSLQGLTGDVKLIGGNGVAISGNTITNTGVVSISAGGGINIVNDGNGNYTIDNAAVGPGGAVLLGSAVAQTDSSNNPSINIDKTGAGNLVQLAVGGVNTFVVDSNGHIATGTIDFANVQNVPSLVNTIGGLNGAVGLGAGLGISGSNIINTGVRSLAGTANQVNVSASTGLITLSLPQNIGTGSSPTFAGMTLNGGLSVTAGGINAAGSVGAVGNLVSGDSVTQGSLILNNGSGRYATINVGVLGQNTVYTLPDPGGATATICLATGNCMASGAAGGDLTGTYPNPTIASLQGVTLTITAPTSGQILQYNGAAFVNQTVTGDVTINGSGVTAIGNGAVTNTKLQNSSLTITAGNGLQGGGLTSLGGSVSLNVQYGSTANTAVQGNTTLTCASGTGNLTGGGNIITLGAGGTCNDLDVVAAPTFSGLVTANGGLAVTHADGISVGNAGLVDGRLVLANSTNSNLQILQASVPTGTGDVNYALPVLPGGSSVTICVDTGNCAGTGGGVTGSGSNGTIAVFTGTGTIGNSNLTDISGTLNYTGANGLLLGNAGVTAGSLTLANSSNSNLSLLQAAAPTGTGTATYILPALVGGASADICLTTGNCAGSGGGIIGSGTVGTIAKFTASGTIGDSYLSESGSALTYSGTMLIQPSADFNNTFEVQNAAGGALLSVDTDDSKVNVSGAVNIVNVANPSSALTAAAGLGGSLTGTMHYVVSYLTDNGETGYGPASSGVAVSSQEVNLSNIPISPSAFVTGRKIYRSPFGAGGPFQLVATINDNVTTTAVDNNTSPTDYAKNVNSTGVLQVDGIAILKVSATTSNLLLGENAGISLTNGTNNTIIGKNAMSGPSSRGGSYNTAVGEGALYVNNNSSYNSAFGYYALWGQTVGGSNSAFGYQALSANAPFSYGVAMGYQALMSNRGNFNTALGYQAGQTSSAGNANTTGSRNTFIGHQAGAGVLSATGLQEVTALGAASIVNSHNTVALGCVASVNGCSASGSVVSIASKGYGTLSADSTLNAVNVGSTTYSTGTISTSGSSATVNGSGTTFTSAMVGGTIYFMDSSNVYRSEYIAAVNSGVQLTIGTARTINASTAYTIVWGGSRTSNSGAMILQNTSNSAGAFQILQADGTNLFNVDTTAAALSTTGSLTVTDYLALRKGIDYSVIGQSDDVDFGIGSFVRLTGASAQTITGIANGTDGRLLTIVNASANTATMSNNSGSSLAANRIITGTGSDLSLPPGASITVIYDDADDLWRLTSLVAGGTGTGVANLGTIDSQTPNADGAVIVGDTLYLQSASATVPGLVNTTSQTFAGDKTFSGLIAGQAGLSIAGATISLNESSNFNTNINTGTSAGAVTIGNTSSGNVNLISGTAVNIGSVASSTASSVTNIANTSNATGNQTVTIGSNASNTNLTTIQGGTGGIVLAPNGGSNSGVVVRPVNDSTAAFAIQNAASTSTLLTADTTINQIAITGGTNITFITSSGGMYGGYEDLGYSVAHTSDGGYVATGTTTGRVGDYNGSIATRLIVNKYGKTGNIEWSRAWMTANTNGSSYTKGNSVSQTSDGGYVIAGQTQNIFLNYDALLLKYDSSGNLSFARTLGGSSQPDVANAVQQTADGGYIVSGYTSSHGAGGEDAFLAKYTSTGTLSWFRVWGGTGNDRSNSVQQTADGGYVMAGQTSSFGAGSNDSALMKYDSSGNLLWNVVWGGSSSDLGKSVKQTSDGGYIVAGQTASFGAGSDDGFLLKYDGSGTLSWNSLWGTATSDTNESVAITLDGGYITAGQAASAFNGQITRYDNTGAVVWSRQVTGTSLTNLKGVAAATDGGFAATGLISVGFGPNNNQEFALFKYDSDGNMNNCGTYCNTMSGTANNPSATTSSPSATTSSPSPATATPTTYYQNVPEQQVTYVKKPGAITAGLNVVGSALFDGLIDVRGGAVFTGEVIASGVTIAAQPGAQSSFRVQKSDGQDVLSVDVNSNYNSLVNNGNFETTTSGTWSQFGSGASLSHEEIAYSGRLALSVYSGSTSSGGARTTLKTTLTPATDYNVSFYARAVAPYSAASIKVVYGVDASAQSVTCANTLTLSASSWKKFDCTFTTPNSGITANNSLFIEGTASTMSFIIDNVIVQQSWYNGKGLSADNAMYESSVSIQGVINTPLTLQSRVNSESALQLNNSYGERALSIDTGYGDNIAYLNSSVEVNLDSWSSMNSGVLSRTTAYSSSGIASLKIDSGASANGGASYSLPSTLSSGTRTISFDMMTTTTGHDFIQVGYYNTSAQYTSCNDSTVTPAASASAPANVWIRYTCTVNMTGTSFYLLFTSDTTSKTFYIDSVRLDAGSVSSAFGIGSISIDSVVNSALRLRNKSDSSTAFQIQNAGGTNQFRIDTSSSSIAINANSTLVQPTSDSATTFRIQNAGATTTLLLADTTNSLLKVAGNTTTFATLEINNAHFKSTQTTAPTIGTPTACGTSPTAAITAGSTDSAGRIQINSGSGSPTTCVTTITFNKAYGAAPKSVIVSAHTTSTGAGMFLVTAPSVTSTTFDVRIADPAGGVTASSSYWIYYWVIE